MGDGASMDDSSGTPGLYPQRKAFVVRFADDAGPQSGTFRGRIEHVGSGAMTSFESPEELWAFVRDALRESPDDVAALPPRGRTA
jgi:hypothetical protein